ncbi:MAG: hypothetical protein PHH91_01000 [Desulfuromonadaceae bacterium]|nr:hypothetical protein [Desulfuromonadaceae bacterium]
MPKKTPDLFLTITAFFLYIVGGVGTFGGIALVLLMGGQDLFGWGDAKPIGYLLVCTGLCLSVMGVLFLRLVRNRTNNLLCQSLKPK